MEPSWIVAVGRLGLYVYFALIGASLLALIYRRTLSTTPAASHGNRMLRLLLEYVGNVDPQEQGFTSERRRNRQARILMDHIKEEMTSRALHPSEAERLMERLRESLRPEEQG